MRTLLGGICLCWLVVATTWAQAPELEQLRQGNDTLLVYQTYYAEASLKDPTNTGARRLKLKLASATQQIDQYLAGSAPRKDIRSALEAALDESKRYRSATAKRLQANLSALVSLIPTLPEESVSASVDSAPESDLSANETSETASSSEAQSSSTVAQPVLTTGSAYYLFAFSLALLLLLGAYLIYQQRRLAQHFLGRLTDLEVYAGFPREGSPTSGHLMHQRLEELERMLAETSGQADARLLKLEQSLHQLRRDQSDLGQHLYGADLLRQRLEDLEHRISAPAEVPEVRVSVLAAANGTGSTRNSSNARKNTQLAELPFESSATGAEHTPLEVLKVLAEWPLQTTLPRLAELATNLGQSLRQESPLETINENLLAEVVQLGYVSAYNDGSLAHYLTLKTFAESRGIVVEDEMAGRMAFSDHLAENVTFETYFGLYHGHGKNLPNLTPQRETLWQHETDSSLLSRTVLRVLQPAILQQKEGAQQVLRKGTYLIKG